LGTMASINGEVVVLDGIAYHLQSSGAARKVEAHEELPFAMVTSLEASQTRSNSTFRGLRSKQSILECLRSLFGGVTNRFVFFLIAKVRCESITVRVVQGQRYPRQPLSELGDAQKVYSYQDVTGSLVGFWSPTYMDGVSVSGLHMHFLSEDRSYGGHVLEVEATQELRMEAAMLNEFDLELPVNEEFDEVTLGVGGEALRKVEG
jgi:alpha-acetolactate decarboxylase